MTIGSTGRTRVAAIGAGVALLAAACGGGGGSGNAAGTAAQPSGAASGGGTTVTVTETEFALDLSTTQFHPGTYTFVAKDAGTATHALEISGPGVTDAHTDTFGPGGSASLTVTLTAGTYDVFCPVDGHKGLGMDTHITVR